MNWHPAAGVTDPGDSAVAAGIDRGSFEALVKSDIIIPGRLRQLRYWRRIAPMCDCTSLSAP